MGEGMSYHPYCYFSIEQAMGGCWNVNFFNEFGEWEETVTGFFDEWMAEFYGEQSTSIGALI